jgi:predicted dienelactone hydrolase
MIIKRLTILFFLICFSAHDFANTTETTFGNLSETSNKNQFITTKVIKLYDKTRNRLIPIILYINTKAEGKANAGIIKMPVVIINHGYTVKNTEYSFLANALAAQGYFGPQSSFRQRVIFTKPF